MKNRRRGMRRSPYRKAARSGFPRDGRVMKPGEWDSIRTRELKPQFEAMGVTRCEGGFKDCTPDDNLGFAHTLKRRHIKTEADKRNVALLCTNCHDKLELQGEARMKRQIEKIIEQRVFRLAAQEAA